MAKEQEAEPDHGPIESSFQPTKESDLAASPSKQPDILEDAADLGLEESASNDARLDKIYRKLDRRIIPAFWLLYFLCAGVRSNVSLAQTMNESQGHDLAEVLHLSSKEVSTGLTLFYVCYVVFDFPSNLIMSKLEPGVWMSRIVVSVGIIGTCMAAMRAAWSLYLLRLLLGIVIAGMWPGMSYYLTLYYPPTKCAKRIGHYYTAAQLSAAVVGLVSAGFQKMDGLGGLVGFQWMFLMYGLVTFLLGVGLLWWLPPRPVDPMEKREEGNLGWRRWVPRGRPALSGEDAVVHFEVMRTMNGRPAWGWRDLGHVLLDWRLWPLVIMYFGVVGVGIGVQSYGTLLISSINPSLSSITLSLLFAPIWLTDLLSILLFTPLADRYSRLRPLFFTLSCLVIIAGLLITTYAPPAPSWSRYGGLLIIGFGLGPTVPVTMAWSAEIFGRRHGDVGVAAATALVSGLGNLGSVVTTYALYEGWAADAEGEVLGGEMYRASNVVCVGIVAASVVACGGLTGVLWKRGELRGFRGGRKAAQGVMAVES